MAIARSGPDPPTVGLIFFAIIVTIAAQIMAEISPFPSRRYMLELASAISVAIIAVSFATRLIRNQTLRRFVKWSLWIFVVLYYTGVTDEVGSVLDSVALDVGNFHLSILTVIKACAIIGVLFTLARLATQGAAKTIKSNKDISPSMQVLAVKALQVFLFGAASLSG